MEDFWRLAREGAHEDILRYFPDDVLDTADELRRQSTPEPLPDLSLADIVAHARHIPGLVFDTFAQRHMFHDPPPVARLQSALRPAPDRALLRFGVAGRAGERSVLAVELVCGERLAPAYRSARIELVWQVVSVAGEGAAGEEGGEEGEEGVGPAARPRPRAVMAPEAVVAAQLEALRYENVSTVFAFASPSAKVAQGPEERFAALLGALPLRPLLRHTRAESYLRAMQGPDRYREVVRIDSHNTGMPRPAAMFFSFDLRLQGSEAGEWAGCWMTEEVRLMAVDQL